MPIIQYGGKIDIINATITQLHLWKECKVLKLKSNMRLLIRKQPWWTKQKSAMAICEMVITY